MRLPLPDSSGRGPGGGVEKAHQRDPLPDKPYSFLLSRACYFV